jgi:hypothetical protein
MELFKHTINTLQLLIRERMPGPDFPMNNECYVNNSTSRFELPFTAYTPGASPAGVGRVNLNSTTGTVAGSYQGAFSHRTTADPNMQADVLRGNWEQTPLSSAFFSPANVAIIQRAIKQGIYKRSGARRWEIDDQSVDELQIIMRAMYLQYGRNLPTDIQGQVTELNNIVIGFAVPKIFSEIEQHFFYLRDISQMPQQMQHPVNVSSAGTKSFDLTSNFLKL